MEDDKKAQIKARMGAWVIVVLFLSWVGYLIYYQIASPSGVPDIPQTPAQAVVDMRQSAAAYNAHDYFRCIEMAQQALKAYPNWPDAYNNIAVGELGLHHFDRAAAAIGEGLKYRPATAMQKMMVANQKWIESERIRVEGK